MRGHTGQSRFPYDDDDDDHYAGAQAGLTSLRAQLSRVADTWEAVSYTHLTLPTILLV